MMQLTEMITARVDGKLKRRIEREVRARRKLGHGIDGADIIREALIEFLGGAVNPQAKLKRNRL